MNTGLFSQQKTAIENFWEVILDCEMTIMDTSLSDGYWYNWGASTIPFDAECVDSPDNNYIIICKRRGKISRVGTIVDQ